MKKKSISIVTTTAIVAEVFLVLVTIAVSGARPEKLAEIMAHVTSAYFFESTLSVLLIVPMIVHKTLVRSFFPLNIRGCPF